MLLLKWEFVEFQEFNRHKYVEQVSNIDVNIIHTLFNAC